MKKRLLSLLLAAALLSVPAAAAPPATPAAFDRLLPAVRAYEGQLTDAADSWCPEAIETVYEIGLMNGKTADCFGYADPLSEAESVVIAARLYAALTGTEIPEPAEDEPWFWPSYALLASLSETVPPEIARLPVTESFIKEAHHQDTWRQTFIGSILLVIHAAGVELPVLNRLEVRPPDTATDTPALLLYRAGILNGTDQYGSFDAIGTLTRGQAAAILARLADPAQRLTFTLTPFDLCADALKLSPDTVLFTTADGQTLTAGQTAYVMAEDITTRSRLWDSSIAWSEAYMQNTLKEYFALEAMAEEAGLRLSQEETADLEAQADRLAGVDGASRESQLFYRRYHALFSLVKASYGPSYNAHGVSEDFEWALAQRAAAVTLTPSDAYRSLDLAAFRQTLLDSPFYSMTAEPLFR